VGLELLFLELQFLELQFRAHKWWVGAWGGKPQGYRKKLTGDPVHPEELFGAVKRFSGATGSVS
jgi:hypothetical protein